jgi:hypothetical protein
MAFDLNTIKTEIAALVQRVEKDLGPWAEKLKEALHAVAEHVHQQAVADEHLVAGQVAEDVQVAKDAVAGATKPSPTAKS